MDAEPTAETTSIRKRLTFEKGYEYFLIAIFISMAAVSGLLIRADQKLFERDSLPFIATVRLNATVSLSGNDLILVNNDNYDWEYVRMQINTGLQGGGYILRTRKLTGGKAHILDTSRFVDDQGNYFNPRLMKFENFTIWCDSPVGYGYWYNEWPNS